MSGSALALGAANPMRVVLLSVLVFEFVTFALAIPVMIYNSDVPGLQAGLLAGGAALLALVAAGLLRRPVGYPVGWATQVVGVLLGLLTPSMFVVGGMFLGLWVLGFVLGRRLEQQGATPAA